MKLLNHIRIPYTKETTCDFLDHNHPPVAVVQPGTRVVFDTMNAFSEETESEDELNEVISRGFHHPFTGPVYIEGVQPGNTVAVHVDEIELGKYAYSCISRSSGVLKGRFPFRNYKKLEILDGIIEYEGLKLPIMPSLGGAGLADLSGTRNGATGNHGGNFDFRFITLGSTLYLPAAVPGGLLYVGDLHALQANGEASGVSFETSGSVTVTINVHPLEIDGPLIQTEQGVLVIGYGETFDDSVKMAVERTVNLLSRFLELKEADAYVLIGSTCDIILGHLTGRIKSVAMQVPDIVLKLEKYLHTTR